MSLVDHSTASLRDEADLLISENRHREAAATLSILWRTEARTAASASFVAARFAQIRENLDLQPYRVAIARSATVEPIVPFLRADAFAAGLDLAIHLGDFNSYVQELVEPDSSVYKSCPDSVFLAVESRSIAPRLWGEWSDLSAADVRNEIATVVGRFRDVISAFRDHSRANLVVQNLSVPYVLSRGILDAQSQPSQAEAFHELNRGMRAITQSMRNVYLLDYDSLVARHGRDLWLDERKWAMASVPHSAANVSAVALEWMKFIHPLSGKIAKVVAVDLDNTLWGGVIGEDGIHGIRLSPRHPGVAYHQIQRALLDVKKRGILLALCSKNNLEDAMQAFEEHPDMLLRASDFSSIRINWRPKSQNLREIASELNLGIDSIAFVDDNPIERDEVRRALPEVTVIDLPSDPQRFAAAIRDSPVLERLSFSQEDFQRSDAYKAMRERKQVESSVTSREDFYRSLDQEIEIGIVSANTLARTAQLTQKTNQFNLTTKRYNEQQIAAMMSSQDWRLYWARVSDRFGDNGLVAVALMHIQGSCWEIDTFLLSCRVIGREVETAFLALIIEDAEAKGATFVAGSFLPTKKNLPASAFYANHGFDMIEETTQGSTWRLDLPQSQNKVPKWMRVKTQMEISK